MQNKEGTMSNKNKLPIISIIMVLSIMIVHNFVFVHDILTQDKLSDNEKRFDIDGNGELNASEKDLMERVEKTEKERGIQFSTRQIRDMSNLQNNRPRGGRTGRSRGSRTPTGPRLNPEQVPFKDGTATIPDRETFKKLSYQGTDVRIDTQLTGIEFVKIQIENMHTDKPHLYFMNTKTHRSHGSFMRAAGLARGQGQMRGVLSYRPLFTSPNGEPGVYTFEFNPNDAFPYKEIKRVHDLLVSKMPILEGRLGYCPLWGAIDLYRREKTLYDAAEFPVYFEDDLYANVGYLPLNTGESFGRLRILEANERPTPRDIVICKTLPNEMSRVAGIITGVRQTPLSHVNLRAIQDKVPNAFITNATENNLIVPLVGKYVYYQVNADGFEIREATQKEVNAHFADLRPATVQKPKRNLSIKKVLPLDEIAFTNSDSFGVKTANIATLRTFGFPDDTVPDGVGVPFYFYDEFMKHNGFYEKVKTLFNDSEFQNSHDNKEAALKKFRDEIKKAKMPAWMMTTLTKLQDTFPKGTPLRCRSSTNNEDLPGFSGAGLYDSFTHNSDEGHLSKSIKQVYASLWNYRAFDAREFYRIDHLTTAMGVLIHPNYADELANGVAVTNDVVYQTIDNYYLNIQIGEDLVTNPNEQSRPEEILLDMRDGNVYRVVSMSNQTSDGKQLLTGSHLRELHLYLGTIHNRFRRLYGSSGAGFAMEIEFKVTKNGNIAIKQARPWVQ